MRESAFSFQLPAARFQPTGSDSDSGQRYLANKLIVIRDSVAMADARRLAVGN
jgi:hypothetical protein